MYRSKSAGELTYSTSADAVLQDPKAFRDLYERVFKLRAAELHWLIRALPARLKANGLHLGGTSEGAMAIARFDDSRYGHLILSRFINSFSIEYCYFTPTREAASIGGRRSVPTLNIIGAHAPAGSQPAATRLRSAPPPRAGGVRRRAASPVRADGARSAVS